MIAAAVASAARSIKAQSFRQAFPEARTVLAPDREKGASARLAIDRHTLVLGATRSDRLSFDITEDHIGGPLPAIDVLAPAFLQSADLDDVERGVLGRVLARAEGNVSAAARILSISRAALHRKLDRLGLSAHSVRHVSSRAVKRSSGHEKTGG